MSLESISFGALHMLAMFYPKAAPIVAAIEKYKDAAPIITNLIKEGPSAFAAAKEKAPGLAIAIEQFVHAHISTGAKSESATAAKAVENATRSVFGLGRMTQEEEMAWMNRANPISDDSRSGSG